MNVTPGKTHSRISRAPWSKLGISHDRKALNQRGAFLSTRPWDCTGTALQPGPGTSLPYRGATPWCQPQLWGPQTLRSSRHCGWDVLCTEELQLEGGSLLAPTSSQDNGTQAGAAGTGVAPGGLTGTGRQAKGSLAIQMFLSSTFSLWGCI